MSAEPERVLSSEGLVRGLGQTYLLKQRQPPGPADPFFPAVAGQPQDGLAPGGAATAVKSHQNIVQNAEFAEEPDVLKGPGDPPVREAVRGLTGDLPGQLEEPLRARRGDGGVRDDG